MSTDNATRCPSCKTVFRVVADQLRMSEGWVRCGRCTNVFNASENMVEMDGSWARLADEADAPVNRRGSAPDIRRTARGPAHRARQDGADPDRLASKIETAMARAQQQPAPPQAFFPPVPAPEAFEFDSGGELLPPYAPPAPQAPYVGSPQAPFVGSPQAPFVGSPQAPYLGSPQAPYGRAQPPEPQVDINLPPSPSGLTYRRPAGGGAAPPANTAPATPWHEEPDPQQALRRELRYQDADEWAPPPARPATPERNPRLMESLQAPDGRRASAQARDSDPDSSYAPLPERAIPSTSFGPTRPESDWAVSSMAMSLDDMRAEPRAEPRPSTRPAAAPKPGFMRKVERDRHWRQPQQRALLLCAVAAGVLLLLLQATLAYKDLLAARFPATRPALQTLCAGLGCTLHAARMIDGLAVESSGLVRVDKTPVYQLQVTLRNRANLELALPALDVTFTDSRGATIARKVLLPQELGGTIDVKPGSHGGTVAAGREVTLQGSLQTTGAAPEVVAGYTVELFYP